MTLGAGVRGLPIDFHSSLLPLAFPSTPEPFRSFGVLSGVSGIPGDCPEFPESSETVRSFRNPQRLSGVSGILRDHPEFLNSTLSPSD